MQPYLILYYLRCEGDWFIRPHTIVFADSVDAALAKFKATDDPDLTEFSEREGYVWQARQLPILK